MNKNELIFTNQLKCDTLQKDELRIVICGKDVITKKDFLETIEQKFFFPESCFGSLDAFMDYIRDLSWLDCEKITLIITDKDDFLSAHIGLKKIILDCFEEEILPYWETDVENTEVNGKRKEFLVYVVDTIC
ncbi:MAG: barstar family protein [Lachnospiraceae bacterium]|jgi:hypothetical protein|nr:barstar family protein [Lachnospiraceae bacterium]